MPITHCVLNWPTCTLLVLYYSNGAALPSVSPINAGIRHAENATPCTVARDVTEITWSLPTVARPSSYRVSDTLAQSRSLSFWISAAPAWGDFAKIYKCSNKCNSPSMLFTKSQLSASHCERVCPARVRPVKTQGQMVSCFSTPKHELVILLPTLTRKHPTNL
jgi:hypothetical protein